MIMSVSSQKSQWNILMVAKRISKKRRKKDQDWGKNKIKLILIEEIQTSLYSRVSFTI